MPSLDRVEDHGSQEFNEPNLCCLMLAFLLAAIPINPLLADDRITVHAEERNDATLQTITLGFCPSKNFQLPSCNGLGHLEYFQNYTN